MDKKDNNNNSQQEVTAGDNDREIVKILYKNYRGDTAVRMIHPRRVWFGSTDWHPEEQWLLDALDVEKGAMRTFAMKDIHHWFRD